MEAIIGIIVGVVAQYLAGEYRSRKEHSRELVTKYLIFLQEASESLFHRIKNINEDGGMALMDKDYYSVSTLYSVSKLLAVDLLMMRDGVYANPFNEKSIVLAIKDIISEIHNEFDRDVFFRYYRIELAEACINERGLSGWHDFRVKVNGENYKEAMDAYRTFLENYPQIKTKNLVKKLLDLNLLLVHKTNVPSSIK